MWHIKHQAVLRNYRGSWTVIDTRTIHHEFATTLHVSPCSELAHVFTLLSPKGNPAPRGENVEPTQTNESAPPPPTAFQAIESLFYTASSDDAICVRCISLNSTFLSGPPFPLATSSIQSPIPSTKP
ncbi:hypothetical protein PMIN03_005632 [Paraphaeosphaeria minitans]